MEQKKLTSERARELGRRSGAARRARRTLRETFQSLLPVLIENDDTRRMAEQVQELTPQMSVQQAIGLATAIQAVGGNLKAVEFIRDTIGEKPNDKRPPEEAQDLEIRITGVD